MSLTNQWKKIASELLSKFILEVKEEKNFDQIKINLLDPMVDYIFDRLYPYILASSIIFLLIFILSLGIFYMILKSVNA